MSKAINWSEQFLDEVMNEDDHIQKIALRIGSLYFDTKYYSNGEIVDIRVNHKIVRKGIIIDDLILCKISELDSEIIKGYKKELNSIDKITNFLSTNYNLLVDGNTEVTVIKYKNLNLNKQAVLDDPHLC